MTDTTELSWRSLEPDREEFFTWVDERIRKKVLSGAKEYGDVFQGDPLEHAIGEALDLLFYLWVERRRRLT